ncbi:hypothetical protein PSPO01_00402 [Paraphaeosphaeria sporulosa]
MILNLTAVTTSHAQRQPPTKPARLSTWHVRRRQERYLALVSGHGLFTTLLLLCHHTPQLLPSSRNNKARIPSNSQLGYASCWKYRDLIGLCATSSQSLEYRPSQRALAYPRSLRYWRLLRLLPCFQRQRTRTALRISLTRCMEGCAEEKRGRPSRLAFLVSPLASSPGRLTRAP